MPSPQRRSLTKAALRPREGAGSVEAEASTSLDVAARYIEEVVVDEEASSTEAASEDSPLVVVSVVLLVASCRPLFSEEAFLAVEIFLIEELLCTWVGRPVVDL